MGGDTAHLKGRGGGGYASLFVIAICSFFNSHANTTYLRRLGESAGFLLRRFAPFLLNSFSGASARVLWFGTWSLNGLQEMSRGE